MPTYNYPENVTNALKEIGLKSEDCLWDCHGQWILKHYACERLAAHNGVTFDDPIEIEKDSEKGTVVIKLWGYLDDKSEFTYGEATPKNSKNSYPYAMAEKRAKDRIILKLIGFHGEIYSEDEAEEFVEEVKAQEKAEKKKEREAIDTSVWHGMKKEGQKAGHDLNNLYAISLNKKDKKKSMKALADAKDIYDWATKHNLVIIQDQYLKLFDKKLKSA
tara:strand:+ start:655 stop:1308 length:654 start_codon:yes stop_codon:yes gene_type:complete